MTRIVIADDHQVVRTGFAGLLGTQPDFTVVGLASDGAEAVRVCARERPDVVLMDVRMPGMDGIEATTRLVGKGTAKGSGSGKGEGAGAVSRYWERVLAETAARGRLAGFFVDSLTGSGSALDTS
ncbi:response regulator, partial [Streptomyces smaragdinus]|uniref:response regulator n=1 Tax=Streptomyces smaragdinus TaxID=2585196 RepID=UPI001295FB46